MMIDFKKELAERTAAIDTIVNSYLPEASGEAVDFPSVYIILIKRRPRFGIFRCALQIRGYLGDSRKLNDFLKLLFIDEPALHSADFCGKTAV